MSGLRDAIRQMSLERGLSEEMVKDTVTDFIKAAYKRKFGTDENVDIKFSDDLDEVIVSAVRVVVEEENYYNEATEIPLDEAEELADGVAVGDSLVIPLDINTFDRGSVQSAKQKAQQSFKEIQNNTVYAEFKKKENTIIVGQIRSKTMSGDLIVSLTPTVEGVLPFRNQSPREVYEINEHVKCYVERVENNDAEQQQQSRFNKKSNHRGVRIVLSRTSPEFVKKYLEQQVPEIYDGQVEIVNVVRQAGVRTKVAVRSSMSDIDPVGATVGLKGNRIQSVMTEIDGEKIDVIRWEENPLQFIANALTPATVSKIIPLDLSKKEAVAIVDDNQLGLAIGQGGVNVKLAKMICDWMIEVKTQSQFEEMEISQEARRKAEALFANSDDFVEEFEEENEESEENKLSNEDYGVGEDETLLSDLELSDAIIKKLNYHDIYSVEEYFELDDDALSEMGITAEEKAEIDSFIDVEEEEDDQFECPNCGAVLTVGTSTCPSCGVEFEFE